MGASKEEILAEIRRTAAENGGLSLGHKRFLKTTGIRQSDWYGKYWAKWSEAIREAGLKPNALNAPLSEEKVLKEYAQLVREVGRVPTAPEIRLKKVRSPDFPSHNVFGRFGSKSALVHRLREFCQSETGYKDVLAIVEADTVGVRRRGASVMKEPSGGGYIYLMQSGSRFKLGKTNSVGRRQRNLQTGSPDPLPVLHFIGTRNPDAAEAFWHSVFASKRIAGEWFELSESDVKRFRRCRSM